MLYCSDSEQESLVKKLKLAFPNYAEEKILHVFKKSDDENYKQTSKEVKLIGLRRNYRERLKTKWVGILTVILTIYFQFNIKCFLLYFLFPSSLK